MDDPLKKFTVTVSYRTSLTRSINCTNKEQAERYGQRLADDNSESGAEDVSVSVEEEK